MSPLNLSTPSGKVPTEFTELLDVLTQRPQPAVVHYAASGNRVELSGRVLANWAVKLIGLFREEAELDDDAEGAEVLIDMATHWKAAAAALAAGALGAAVRLAPVADVSRGGAALAPEARWSRAGTPAGATPSEAVEARRPSVTAAGVALVVTDRPQLWAGSEALGDAELAAVSHGMLDASFGEASGEELPAWVLDVSAEVRQQPDQLLEPLTPKEIPTPDQDPASPQILTTWAADSAEAMFQVWATGGVVVLFDGEPAGALWEQMLVNERAG